MPGASTGSAFKPLPSLPGTFGISRNVQGPAVKIESAPTTAPRLPLAFGGRTAQTTASLTTVAQDPIDSSKSDAVSFFRNFKVTSKREAWDIKEEDGGSKPNSKFKCCCRRIADTRVLYQPSTAAHTVRQHDLCEPKSDTSDTASDPRPVRFLDLPGEIRNRIYRAAISPGHISLRSCATHHMSVGVEPPLATGMLANSKQLAHETKDLVFESTFIVDVYLETGVRSVINSLQLLCYFLDRIQHVVLVLDFTRVWNESPSRLDWRPIQAMTALKSLRLFAIHLWPTAIYNPNRTLQDLQRDTIQTILECIPASCAVEYGWQSEAEEKHVREMHRRITLLRGPLRQRFSKAEIADHAELAAAASSIDRDLRKGWKNGSKVDFRFTGTEG